MGLLVERRKDHAMATSATPVSDGPERPDDKRPLAAAERAEYERLRRAAAVRHSRLRTAGASVLLLLAFLLAPLGVVAVWADSEVSDADRYVETVDPLATEPAVQNMVIDRLTNRVVSNVDVDQVTAALATALANTGAPPIVVDHADALSGALMNALTAAVHQVVQGAVTSDQFAQAWENANRRAHAAVVKVITGQGSSAVQATDNTIVLDIGTVVDNVQQRLVDTGFEKAGNIPDVDRQIVLLQTDELQTAQGAMRLLDILGTWLPVVIVVLAALGVWLAPSHRIGLMVAGIGIGVMMIVLLVGLAVLRQLYVDSVPPGTQPQDAAATIFDTLVRFLRDSTRTVLVIAVITVVAGYLYGPGRGARAIRSGAARATGATGRAVARAGLRTGGAGRWLARHSRLTTGIVIGAGALALALWNYPTPASIALVLLIVVVTLALLGVLAAAGTQPTPAGPDGGPTDAAAGPPTTLTQTGSSRGRPVDRPPDSG
ncbi:integral membrane protein [Candidatus Protofrankia californiensis]|uniref:Integral membrane protein n=1 Tax=Candidatus Protofrankia californiensis TaxID=1839754 RepID=A0A1C3PB61_9ACTN|nr:integral membrane protein [Candidatus Protofrankia californiensis]